MNQGAPTSRLRPLRESVTLEFDPPHRVSFTWHPCCEPDTAQMVDVSFAAAGEGTVVELVHAGWETFGEEAREMRERCDGGWTSVLELFREGP